MKYAMLLADAEREAKGASKGQHIENIVKGIIEGETRVIVSKYPILSRSNISRRQERGCHIGLQAHFRSGVLIRRVQMLS
jgi:hypothetical protein